MLHYLMVTGAYRSGTTLLDKLLNTHAELIVASQLFQGLLFEIKKKFLRLRGLDRIYPIDPLFGEKDYGLEEFTKFLEESTLSDVEVVSIFQNYTSYSGTYNPEILVHCLRANVLKGGDFYQLFEQLNSGIISFFGQSPVFVGAKEVFSEEYIPYLLGKNVKIIQIIRDPRDVIVSSVAGSATGDPPPVLYTARMWRKHVAFYSRYKKDDNFLSIRYEDLVRDVGGTLDQIASFLGVDPFPTNILNGGIRDQYGRLWEGNSSFSAYQSVSTASIGRYRDVLSSEAVRYIEAVCYPEMRLLNYKFERRPENSPLVDLAGLHGFRDELGKKSSFPPDYSFQPAQLTNEIQRLNMLTDANVSSQQKQSWFMFPEAYVVLSQTIEHFKA